MQAKALWHLSTHQSIIQQATIDVDAPIRLKSLYSLISTGTERLVAKGQVPMDMKSAMQVPFMEGDFDFPIKYGYSLVATIISEGEWYGQLVHLLHPHQDYLQVNASAISLIPENIPAKRATLASNMETALNAIWDSQVSIGDEVLVVGFGMIGGLVARLLSLLPAVNVTVAETNPYRMQLAKEMGFMIENEPTSSFDYSFHTTGTSKGLQLSIDKVGLASKVIELSWYGNKSVQLQLGHDFHSLRKQIISSQVGQIPTNKSHRWDYDRRKATVFELLKNPIFDAHISHEIPFAQSPLFFDGLRKGEVQSKGLGWVIVYPE